MKLSKKLTCSLAAGAVVASMGFVSAASAEVSASVGISNMYLWRGFNLGSNLGSGDSDSLGSGAIFGDVTYSIQGFHAGVWGSSGDAFAGTEYDLIIGYGGEVGNFTYDISWISYVYPNDPGETNINDFVEIVASFGFGPVSFAYHDNIESEPGTYALGEDYSYFNVGVAINEQFSVAVGRHDLDGDPADDNPTHLDLTYNYNDNLSFTVSKLVADEDSSDDDTHFAVSYSIPIE